MILCENPRIEVFNEDCMEVMARYETKYFDLAIVDIPYGLGDKLTNGGTWAAKYKKGDADWDKLPSSDYFKSLFCSSKNQIIWGGNYVSLPANRCYLIWDKVALMNTMADSEYAWTSFDLNAKTFRHVRNTNEKRIHITQKPVALYKWLLQNYAKEGDKILDTHGGSGSILIACWEMGFDIVWTELDKDYYEAAIKRFRDHVTANPKLFTPQQQYGTQLTID